MPWIDLDEVKQHLNKTNTSDDYELEGFLEGACSAIEEIKGHVDVAPFATSQRARPLTDHSRYRHYHGGAGYGWRRWFVELPESPVLTVTSVAAVAGNAITTAVLAEDLAAGVLGWRLEDTLLFVPASGTYEIAYTAGRDPVPANYRLAALELTAHLWRGSQLNQSSGRPQVGGDQMMVVPHIASAMPYRVRELLGLYGNVVNDHVVIA